jgi:hypothetical protein
MKPKTDEPKSKTEEMKGPTDGVKVADDGAHVHHNGVNAIRQRVKDQREKVQRAAQTGEAAPHTREDPSLNHNHNQQQNRARAESPQQRFFRVVAWVLGWEVTALSQEQRGAVAQTIASLTRSGYTEADVRRFWSEIWLRDWRWTRNREHPKPTQLRSEIFRLRAQASLAEEVRAPASAPAPAATPSPDELDLIEKLKEASKREKLGADCSIRERLDLSNLQRPGMGAAHR